MSYNTGTNIVRITGQDTLIWSSEKIIKEKNLYGLRAFEQKSPQGFSNDNSASV